MNKKILALAILLPLLLVGCTSEEEPNTTDNQQPTTTDTGTNTNTQPTASSCGDIQLVAADCYFSDKKDTLSFKLANLGQDSYTETLNIKALFGEYSSQQLTSNTTINSKSFKEITVPGVNQPTKINSIELSGECAGKITLDFCPNLIEDQDTQLTLEVKFDKHSYKPGDKGKATITLTDTVPQNYQAEYPDVLNKIEYSFDPVGSTIQALRQRYSVTDFAYGKPNVKEKDFTVTNTAEPGFHKIKLWVEWYEGDTDETFKKTFAADYSILVTQ